MQKPCVYKKEVPMKEHTGQFIVTTVVVAIIALLLMSMFGQKVSRDYAKQEQAIAMLQAEIEKLRNSSSPKPIKKDSAVQGTEVLVPTEMAHFSLKSETTLKVDDNWKWKKRPGKVEYRTCYGRSYTDTLPYRDRVRLRIQPGKHGPDRDVELQYTFMVCDDAFNNQGCHTSFDGNQVKPPGKYSRYIADPALMDKLLIFFCRNGLEFVKIDS